MSQFIKTNFKEIFNNLEPITESSVFNNNLSETSDLNSAMFRGPQASDTSDLNSNMLRNSLLSDTSMPFISNNPTMQKYNNKNMVLSSTSDNLLQNGGNDDLASENVKSSDINNLINMLTSETSTATNQLESNVKSRLEQNGGGDLSTEQIESKLYSILKQNGGNNKNLIKLNLKPLDPITESDVAMHSENLLTQTTSEFSPVQQIGGVRKLNPWMIAFGEIRKLISEELKIPNGKEAMQIGKVLYDDAKKQSGTNEKNVTKVAKELLSSNLQKYKKLKA
jgi:hypothetical protein